VAAKEYAECGAGACRCECRRERKDTEGGAVAAVEAADEAPSQAACYGYGGSVAVCVG